MQSIIRAVVVMAVSSSISFAAVTADGAKLEKVAETSGMPDGPAWDGKGSLWFPDVKAQQLYRFEIATGKLHMVKDQAGRISAAYWSPTAGGLIGCDNGNARIVRWDGGDWHVIAGHSDPKKKPNDLVSDDRGGIYHTVTGGGKVYYTPPGTDKLIAVITGIKTPNGLILSPDGKTLYVAAAQPREIWAYDVKVDGSVGGGRLFAAMEQSTDKGGADGMAADVQGNIYCAGPTAVWVWSPAGKLIEKIVPPVRPINCTFAGEERKTLYITAGPAIYRIRMNVAGAR